MAKAAISRYIEGLPPGIEMVMLSADDTNTYASRKFDKVDGAIACFNVDTDDSISVVNSDSSAIDGTDETVLINSSSASSSAIFLILFGSEGALA